MVAHPDSGNPLALPENGKSARLPINGNRIRFPIFPIFGSSKNCHSCRIPKIGNHSAADMDLSISKKWKIIDHPFFGKLPDRRLVKSGN